MEGGRERDVRLLFPPDRHGAALATSGNERKSRRKDSQARKRARGKDTGGRGGEECH